MSEKHCRLVSFAPSVQKRASSKKDRYHLGKWLFAIVGRFGFAQERNSFFCRRRTTAPAAKHPGPPCRAARRQCASRSEEHTSELQSLMRTSYAVFCLKKKKNINKHTVANKSKE